MCVCMYVHAYIFVVEQCDGVTTERLGACKSVTLG